MISEKEYVINSFKSHFESFKNKRIAIYGVGNNTKVLLDEFNDYNFLGLMDQAMTGNDVFGKRVLSFKEVLSLEIELIIIVAQSSNTKIIYKRIDEFCKKNKIAVYDINGNNLHEIERDELENNPYFEISLEGVKQDILKYDVISFDIFDTLVMRKVLYPTDIFEVVESIAYKNYGIKCNYAINRMQAERELNLVISPNIHEIYERFRKKTNITQDECEKLIRLEVEIEKQNLIARESMVQLLNWTVNRGKKVYLISDMYLPVNILEEILSSLGIVRYDGILVSCEARKSKCNGLYGIYKNIVGSRNLLHIGDNYEADGLMAQAYGIDTFSIKSARDMLLISRSREIVGLCESITDRLMVGLLISKIFNNPFVFNSTKGKIEINSLEDFGYVIIAPIITQFMLWLKDSIRENELELILFPSRDGFLIEKLYKMLKNEIYIGDKLPDCIYFQTSRMSSVIAGIKNDEDISNASSLAFSGSLEEMLLKRFFLEKSQITQYNNKEDKCDYILKHKDLIYEKAKKSRQNYEIYIKKIALENYNRIGFFDFVSKGTCQRYIEKIIDKKMYGLYFIKVYDQVKQKQNIFSLYNQECIYDNENYIFDNYMFLENIITSFKPTVKSFDENGKVVYLPENRTQQEIDEICLIHGGIIKCFTDFCNFGIIATDGYINTKLVERILTFNKDEYSDKKVKILDKITYVDEFCNR